MCHSTLDAPPLPCSFSSSSNLIDLARILQETAQALRVASQVDQDPDKEAAQSRSEPSVQRTADERRTYWLPGHVVDEERELLDLYEAEDWRDILHTARYRLEATARLMRHFDEEKRIDGLFLNQIAGDLLMPALDMLSRLGCLLAEFRTAEE